MKQSLLTSWQSYQPIRFDVSRYEKEAAVLLGLTPIDCEPHVILIKRASGLSTHAGEVAFPGGMLDDTDSSLRAAALREAHEEVNLAPDYVELFGPLSTFVSRWNVKVTPFVGYIPELPELTPNPGEIDEVFTVPISFFQRENISAYTRLHYESRSFDVAEFMFEDRRVWGMTALILTDFLHQCFGFDVKPREVI
jgi:8-oxo-dGTP pyrophosphatase MutT (NUDIX family)